MIQKYKKPHVLRVGKMLIDNNKDQHLEQYDGLIFPNENAAYNFVIQKWGSGILYNGRLTMWIELAETKK